MFLFGKYYNDRNTPGVGASSDQIKITLKLPHFTIDKFYKVIEGATATTPLKYIKEFYPSWTLKQYVQLL